MHPPSYELEIYNFVLEVWKRMGGGSILFLNVTRRNLYDQLSSVYISSKDKRHPS